MSGSLTVSGASSKSVAGSTSIQYPASNARVYITVDVVDYFSGSSLWSSARWGAYGASGIGLSNTVQASKVTAYSAHEFIATTSWGKYQQITGV
jgi:hypothetical protein